MERDNHNVYAYELTGLGILEVLCSVLHIQKNSILYVLTYGDSGQGSIFA